MTVVYKVLSAGEIIEQLRALPDGSNVVGVDFWIHSDRGWYERGALDPSHKPIQARALADTLEDQLGHVMHGWKGGEYYFDAHLPVAVAEEGNTGPLIAGFVATSIPGQYAVVAVETY